jgi:hypothetical protein
MSINRVSDMHITWHQEQQQHILPCPFTEYTNIGGHVFREKPDQTPAVFLITAYNKVLCCFLFYHQTITTLRDLHNRRRLQILPRQTLTGTAQVEFCASRKVKTNALEPERAAARPPSRLCYSPTVFFRHISLISLSFPQGKKSARV